MISPSSSITAAPTLKPEYEPNEVLQQIIADVENKKDLTREEFSDLSFTNSIGFVTDLRTGQKEPSLNINNYIVNKVSYDVLNIVNYYKDEEEIDAHNLKSNYLKLPQAVCDHNDK